jgi:hypothetical protein
MDIQKVLGQIVSEEDYPIQPVNLTADILLSIADAVERLQDNETSYVFNLDDGESYKKILKHLIKAGQLLVDLEDPVFTAEVTLTLSNLEAMHND